MAEKGSACRVQCLRHGRLTFGAGAAANPVRPDTSGEFLVSLTATSAATADPSRPSEFPETSLASELRAIGTGVTDGGPECGLGLSEAPRAGVADQQGRWIELAQRKPQARAAVPRLAQGLPSEAGVGSEGQPKQPRGPRPPALRE